MPPNITALYNILTNAPHAMAALVGEPLTEKRTAFLLRMGRLLDIPVSWKEAHQFLSARRIRLKDTR